MKTPLATFRDSITKIVPRWLLGFVGVRLLYSMTVVIDAFEQQAWEGVRARFPGVGTPTALPYIGRDRQIIRGFAEPDASYIARCIRWWDDLKAAGSNYAVLRQIQGYLTPADGSQYADTLRIVDNSGNWYSLTGDTFTVNHSANWNWDNQGTAWWRVWLIIYSDPVTGPFLKDRRWGDGGKWGSGRTWGTTATRNQGNTLRAIWDVMKGAHTDAIKIIIAFDPASFSPSAALNSAGMPDGTWGKNYKLSGGVAVPSRLTTARYFDGA